MRHLGSHNGVFEDDYPAQDLAKDRAPHHKKSSKFYEEVAAQLVQQQHSLDVFACALDQVCTSLFVV